jgi:CheY-like chemotaxis protein
MLVLIVDDEEDMLNVLRGLLTSKGYEVLSARNGAEALERMKQVKFDLIIADIYMPVMDGIKLHKAVRENPETAKMPFLFMSGYDDEYTAGAVRDARYEAFWKKASSVKELVQWVEYLSQPEGKRSKIRPGSVDTGPFVGDRPESAGTGGGGGRPS